MSDDTESTTRAVARRFADALCRAEWFEAGRQLAGAATYALRGRRVLGRRKIMALFRDNTEWAEAEFDSVGFDYEVRKVEGAVAWIRFTDRLERGGRAFEHESEELAEVNAGRELIMNLTHIDIPGEDERLRAFLREVGVSE
ncbi:MAG: hypothetical protein ACQEVA_10925 [Myxococcota bacterium]